MSKATCRPTAPLVLSSDERDYLERQVRRRCVARSMSERCRIILRCSDGLPSKVVAVELGVHEHTVGKWRRRFLKDRIEGLLDEARPGRPRTIDDDQVAAVIERTLRSTPADATHWSIRSMAGAAGFSHTTIRRIWTAYLAASYVRSSILHSLETMTATVKKVHDAVGPNKIRQGRDTHREIDSEECPPEFRHMPPDFLPGHYIDALHDAKQECEPSVSGTITAAATAARGPWPWSWEISPGFRCYRSGQWHIGSVLPRSSDRSADVAVDRR
jgi:transposase